MKTCLDCSKSITRLAQFCKEHGYEHRVRPRGLNYILKKENPTSFKKGSIPWSKGMMLKSLDQYSKGYDAIHEWVERHFGKPEKCEKCGSGERLQWSNKSGKYLRVFSDWQRLCTKCHARYDYEMFGARKAFYE